jgi:hypothetical protein
MALEGYLKEVVCVPIMINICKMPQSWIVERHRHFDDFKSLLFLLLMTKVSLKITVKETSVCTFMCSLDVLQGFNFLIILPVSTKMCRNIMSLQETAQP